VHKIPAFFLDFLFQLRVKPRVGIPGKSLELLVVRVERKSHCLQFGEQIGEIERRFISCNNPWSASFDEGILFFFFSVGAATAGGGRRGVGTPICTGKMVGLGRSAGRTRETSGSTVAMHLSLYRPRKYRRSPASPPVLSYTSSETCLRKCCFDVTNKLPSSPQASQTIWANSLSPPAL